MIDFKTIPIDVTSPNGKWISTYRYEPFLKKWFYIEPNMHATIKMFCREGVAKEVLDVVQSIEYKERHAYYAPLKVQVQINKSCNYHCKMCYAYDEEHRHEQINRKRLSYFFSDAKRSGVVRVNFVGGEVFMRNDFSDIVEEARSNHFLASCISNGIIPGASVKRYQKVLDDLFNIQISCNGIGKSYEQEYGCADWNKAAHCISNTISNTKTNILSFVISEKNYTDIPIFLDFANKIHPSIVKFGTICWSGNSRGQQTQNYYKHILPVAKRFIEDGREKYGNLKIQSQLDAGNDTPLWEDYTSGYRPFEFYFSPEGKDGLYLKSNGDYYPFPLLSDLPEFRIGSIEDGLQNLWDNSIILDKLRLVTFENSACGKQGCTSVCGLWNRSYAYSWTGDLYGKIPCELTDWK